jgi:hypothetical protein
MIKLYHILSIIFLLTFVNVIIYSLVTELGWTWETTPAAIMSNIVALVLGWVYGDVLYDPPYRNPLDLTDEEQDYVNSLIEKDNEKEKHL